MRSPTTGPSATLEVRELEEGDASTLILGLRPRSFAGADEATARIEGPDRPVDLRAEHVVRATVDGEARTVDLRAGAERAGAVTPEELAKAMNSAFGRDVATVDGGRLALVSPTTGAGGSVALDALIESVERLFVSRALVRGEAAEALLGVATAEASGRGAASATIVGAVDLTHGIDLSSDGWLRISVDDGAAQDVHDRGTAPARHDTRRHRRRDQRGARPERRRRRGRPTAADVADCWRDEQHRALATDARRCTGSRRAGAGNDPRTDAVDVSFLGTVDLGSDIDLSAGGTVRLRIDGVEHEVDCAGADAAHSTALEIADAVNAAFAARVATIEDARIRLRPLGIGAGGELTFLVPTGGTDATPRIFGITPPRTYRGADAEPARVVGAVDFERRNRTGHPDAAACDR